MTIPGMIFTPFQLRRPSGIHVEKKRCNTKPVTADSSTKRNKHSQFQSFLLIGLFLFFVGHFLLLNPSSLESDFGGIRVVEPQNLLAFLKNEAKTAVADVPQGIVPSYSLKDSIMYTSNGTKPNFKLVASRSNFYQAQQIIHALEVLVTFDDGTTVKANEGVFFTEKNQANFYGAVHTVFANGATLDSERATAFMKPVTKIVIPNDVLATGMKADENSITHFTAYGLEYVDESPKVLKLFSKVHVWIENDKVTDIYSDRARYAYEDGFLNFEMNENRPLYEQFVLANQIDLNMKSRTLEMQLDDDQALDKITARGDVWTKDFHDPEKITTSTSGVGIYDQQKNDITLTEFPQVYQDGDTITGDVIIDHRNTDQIEVKESNAIYNNGKPKTK
jgi:lipopolysaccharide transport protein LptA